LEEAWLVSYTVSAVLDDTIGHIPKETSSQYTCHVQRTMIHAEHDEEDHMIHESLS
jgi:hypothetical protein